MPARVREVTSGQARIQPFSQVDQLIDGVALQSGRRIDVIPWLYPAYESNRLPSSHIFEVKDGPDVHGDRSPRPVEVGHLQHGLLPAGGGNDPFGETFAHPLEDVLEARHPVPALSQETRLDQGAFHRVSGGCHPGLLVAEQVDVIGGAVDDPVRDQGVAAS
jgi:hypothetical protein